MVYADRGVRQEGIDHRGIVARDGERIVWAQAVIKDHSGQQQASGVTALCAEIGTFGGHEGCGGDVVKGVGSLAGEGLAALGGDVIGCIDNCERPLGGDLLNQICTQPLINVRLFQTLTNQRVVNRIALYATGNNLRLLGDVTRRSLVGRLDPQCERPELREFETENPCVIAMRERPVLVVAILNIVRAFVLAGCPRETAALGSYESWSR